MFLDVMQAQPTDDAQQLGSPANDPVGDGSRGVILSAAAQCFMERGYTETSIDDVARRLGATKGRVYHHFASKADLFAAIFRTGMDMDYAAIEPYRELAGNALDRLRAMARAHCRQIIVSRPYQRVVWQGVQMLLRGSTTPELRADLLKLSSYRDDYEQIFRQVIEVARDEGRLRFDNLSISVSLMFVTLNSPIFWYAQRPDETEKHIEKLVVQIVAFAMRGLGSQED